MPVASSCSNTRWSVAMPAWVSQCSSKMGLLKSSLVLHKACYTGTCPSGTWLKGRCHICVLILSHSALLRDRHTNMHSLCTVHSVPIYPRHFQPINKEPFCFIVEAAASNALMSLGHWKRGFDCMARLTSFAADHLMTV